MSKRDHTTRGKKEKAVSARQAATTKRSKKPSHPLKALQKQSASARRGSNGLPPGLMLALKSVNDDRREKARGIINWKGELESECNGDILTGSSITIDFDVMAEKFQTNIIHFDSKKRPVPCREDMCKHCLSNDSEVAKKRTEIRLIVKRLDVPGDPYRSLDLQENASVRLYEILNDKTFKGGFMDNYLRFSARYSELPNTRNGTFHQWDFTEMCFIRKAAPYTPPKKFIIPVKERPPVPPLPPAIGGEGTNTLASVGFGSHIPPTESPIQKTGLPLPPAIGTGGVAGNIAPATLVSEPRMPPLKTVAPSGLPSFPPAIGTGGADPVPARVTLEPDALPTKIAASGLVPVLTVIGNGEGDLAPVAVASRPKDVQQVIPEKVSRSEAQFGPAGNVSAHDSAHATARPDANTGKSVVVGAGPEATEKSLKGSSSSVKNEAPGWHICLDDGGEVTASFYSGSSIRVALRTNGPEVFYTINSSTMPLPSISKSGTAASSLDHTCVNDSDFWCKMSNNQNFDQHASKFFDEVIVLHLEVLVHNRSLFDDILSWMKRTFSVKHNKSSFVLFSDNASGSIKRFASHWIMRKDPIKYVGSDIEIKWEAVEKHILAVCKSRKKDMKIGMISMPYNANLE